MYDYPSNSGHMIGFGQGYDIYVSSGCNANNDSSTYSTGYSYQMPNTEYYLNGSQHFIVKELEVFTSE